MTTSDSRELGPYTMRGTFPELPQIVAPILHYAALGIAFRKRVLASCSTLAQSSTASRCTLMRAPRAPASCAIFLNST